MKEQGYVQVYTGDGKGKTTASIGLTIRALGAGKKVCLLQFMKNKEYSEHKILESFYPQLVCKTFGKPFFIATDQCQINPERLDSEVVFYKPSNPPIEYVNMIKDGLKEALAAVSSGEYDLVVLDEINLVLFFELAKWEALKAILDARKPEVELVLTGRKADQRLLACADLVTDMQEAKHYYAEGVQGRLGIEL